MSLQTIINTVFFGGDGRVRSGWRFVFFMIAFLFLTVFLVGFGTAIMSALPVGYTPGSLEGYTMQFGLMLVAVLASAWLCGRVFEELPFAAHGFGISWKALRNVVTGAATGAASIAFAAFIAYLFGGLSFRAGESGHIPVLLTLGATFVIFTFGAAFEEALFRGYAMQTFVRSELALFGVAVTSLLFATMHNGNPGASPMSWLNTFLAGIWLAVCYFKTRDLWFAFGVHLMWNWFQGSIFGISVSGLAELAPAPLLRATDHGPAWLTGGAYGLEAGVACTVALVASSAAIWFWPSKNP